MGVFQSFVIVLLGIAATWQMFHISHLRKDLEQSRSAYATLQSDYGQSIADTAQIREQLWITKAEGEIFARALLDYQRENPPVLRSASN
jgi:hypothetical protein